MKKEQERLTVFLKGDLDHHSAQTARIETEKALLTKPKELVLDFSQVAFMDSSGFGFVMGRYATVSAYGGQVKAQGCSKRVFQMLKMAGAQRFVELEEAK